MTILWFFIALSAIIFLVLTIPGAWEEHKRGELEQAVLEFGKAVNMVSVSITASRKQVAEFVKALNEVMAERASK